MPNADAISRVVVSCISGIAIVLIAGVIACTVTSLRIASTRHALRTPCMLRLKKRSVRSISVGAGLPAMVSSVIGCPPELNIGGHTKATVAIPAWAQEMIDHPEGRNSAFEAYNPPTNRL